MRTTQTNGNSQNGIKGSRLRFWDDAGHLVGEMTVPHRNARYYCQKWPRGKYGKEYWRLCKLAMKGVER